MLVPDEVVIGMINNKLDANRDARGFIFDGFPRTVAQAVALDSLLESHDAAISGMIALEVGEDELRLRLAKRALEQDRPDDAKPEVITKRIEEDRKSAGKGKSGSVRVVRGGSRIMKKKKKKNKK